jgi:hypothetical protein
LAEKITINETINNAATNKTITNDLLSDRNTISARVYHPEKKLTNVAITKATPREALHTGNAKPSFLKPVSFPILHKLLFIRFEHDLPHYYSKILKNSLQR